ncbi:MAG: hypothetical protein WKF37_23155 [Bryobacteraceae bacterium]
MHTLLGKQWRYIFAKDTVLELCAGAEALANKVKIESASARIWGVAPTLKCTKYTEIPGVFPHPA